MVPDLRSGLKAMLNGTPAASTERKDVCRGSSRTVDPANRASSFGARFSLPPLERTPFRGQSAETLASEIREWAGAVDRAVLALLLNEFCNQPSPTGLMRCS
jgi:hypothetical protein